MEEKVDLGMFLECFGEDSLESGISELRLGKLEEGGLWGVGQKPINEDSKPQALSWGRFRKAPAAGAC